MMIPTPSHAPQVLLTLACASVTVLLAGCQVYRHRTLDLPAHRAAIADRIRDTEPIQEFVDRLRDAGANIPEAYDLEDGLTFAEGEVLALFNNPDLRVLRSQAGVALAEFETAGLWEDPEFGFDAAELLSPSGPLEYGLTFGLTLPISGRLGVAKDRAGTMLEAERRRLVSAEWALRFRVRQAWVEWTVAEEHDRLARELATQVEDILTIIDALEANGELTRIEARLFRVDLANRRTTMLETSLDAERARLGLLRLMGIGPGGSVVLVPAIEFPVPETPEDPATRVLRANPQLDVLRAQYEAAEATLRLEIREQYPDIELGTGFGSEDNDRRFLFGVSVPLPIFNVNTARISTARAEREVVRAEAEARLEHLLHELAFAQRSYEVTRLQRDELETEIVPLLQEQIDEAQEVARLGEVDPLLLLETIALQAEAKGRLLSLQLAEAVAGLRVAALLGPDTKSDPVPVEQVDPESRGERP